MVRAVHFALALVAAVCGRRRQIVDNTLAPLDADGHVDLNAKAELVPSGATSRSAFLKRCASKNGSNGPIVETPSSHPTLAPCTSLDIDTEDADGKPSRAGLEACRDVRSTQLGDWVSNHWQPVDCDLRELTPCAVRRCLFGRRIGFFGDSLLRNIWERVVQILLADDDRRTRREYIDALESARLMRCDAPAAILEYMWTPSAFGLTSSRPSASTDWHSALEPRLDYEVHGPKCTHPQRTHPQHTHPQHTHPQHTHPQFSHRTTTVNRATTR